MKDWVYCYFYDHGKKGKQRLSSDRCYGTRSCSFVHKVLGRGVGQKNSKMFFRRSLGKKAPFHKPFGSFPGGGRPRPIMRSHMRETVAECNEIPLTQSCWIFQIYSYREQQCIIILRCGRNIEFSLTKPRPPCIRIHNLVANWQSGFNVNLRE